MSAPPPKSISDHAAFVADEIAEFRERLRSYRSVQRSVFAQIYDDPDFDFSSRHGRVVRHRVLFAGPNGFREGVWDTRAKYIFPDLLSALGDDCLIWMLIPPPPDFAVPLLRELAERFSLKIFFTGEKQKGHGLVYHWADQIHQVCEVFKPTVVSNMFGSLLFGPAVSVVQPEFGYRSVLRFAGDEIGARIAMEKYVVGDERHAGDVRDQLLGVHPADAIIAMSPWEKARLCEFVGDPSKVKVCIRGVDLDQFAPPTKPRNWPPKNILFVGRKSEEKGYSIVEGAADMLARDTDVQFWFAGTFDRGESGNKHYLGFVQAEDLPALYQRMDALVLASHTEGFPQVVVEAMATGLPTILSRHLFESMFRHGIDTMLTELDPQSVVGNINALRSSADLCDLISKNSRAFALRHFDRSAWKREYRSIVLGEQSEPIVGLPSAIT